MTVRFAIVGAGRIGTVHAKAIVSNNNAILAALYDANRETAQNLAQNYRHTGCEIRDLDDITNADDIDAVVICTPTDTHAELIEILANAGKAVFCEKPIDLDLDRVRACVNIVNNTGIRFMVGLNRRFDPHFLALKQAISDGDIGNVEMIQITSRDPGAPPADYIRSSGGIFKDMTIHDFDMARFLLPEEPTHIYATASVLTDPKISTLGDFDSASIIITTASGIHCSISNSRRATYGYDQRIEVHGSKGMVRAENQRPVSIERAGATGFTRPPLHDFFMTRYLEAYAAEISAFIEGIEKGIAIAPDAKDGLQALVLAEAALLSVKQKRAVALSELTG